MANHDISIFVIFLKKLIYIQNREIEKYIRKEQKSKAYLLHASDMLSTSIVALG